MAAFSVSHENISVYCNRNRNLQTSKATLEGQAQGTSLFASAASNQRVSTGHLPVSKCMGSEGPVVRRSEEAD